MALDRHRWWILGGISLAIVLSELFEHTVLTGEMEIIEIGQLLLSLVVLALAAILLGALRRSLQQQMRYAALLEARHALSARLGRAENTTQVVEQISEYCQAVYDLTVTSLELVGHPAAELAPTASASDPTCVMPRSNGELCLGLPADGAAHQTQRAASDVLQGPAWRGPASLCLPLPLGNLTIAKLHLALPEDALLTTSGINSLITTAPEMATALEAAAQREARRAAQLRTAREEQQRRIGRDLHDSLGQNLAFLRLKLEHRARDARLAGEAELDRELTQLCQVATESCDLVRDTLQLLQAQPPLPLASLLREQAAKIRGQSALAIAIAETGRPRQVQANTVRQLLYLFREAVSNAELHGHATRVDVTLGWQAAALTVSIQDNGCGFDAHAAVDATHLGLKNMRERAEMVGGLLQVCSSAEAGTCVQVRLPLSEDAPEPHSARPARDQA